MGAIWGSDSEVLSGWLDLALLNLVEKHLFNSNPDIWVVALWTWTNGLRRVKPPRHGSLNVLDRLLSLFLTDEISVHALDYLGWALTCQLLPNRNYWAPKLTEDEKVLIRTRCQQSPKPRSDVRGYTTSGAVVVAYFARNVWSDKKLIQVLKPVARELRENFGGSAASREAFDEMLWTLEGKGAAKGRTNKQKVNRRAAK